jgi:diacylglycerol O-acyltransferase/trehalose O-mycolyltransferase
MTTLPSGFVRALTASALAWAASALLPSSASAQTCPNDPSAAFIMQTRCLTPSPAPRSEVAGQPCKPDDVTKPMAATARTVEVSICSKALSRVVKLRMLLPPSYYVSGSPAASTLYLLHGANNSSNIVSENDYADWIERTTVRDLSQGTHAFVVSPEGGSIGWYSDWRRPAKAVINWQTVDFQQKWETHFFDEVLPLLAAAFPKQNENRVIAGISMGGLGAVSWAARAPLHGRFFRAAAAFSGALSVKNNYAVVQATLANKLQDANNLWGSPTSSDNVWAAHDPRSLVDQLVNLPIWVASGNGVYGGTGFDPVEAGAWAMGTDYANAQDSAINRARDYGQSPKGYVVRDMGKPDPATGINYGCPGRHEWDNWPVALRRAWPFLRANLVATTSDVPAKPQVPPCGEPTP